MSLRSAIHAEVSKLLSLPSTVSIVLAVLVLPAGLAAAMGLNMTGPEALTSINAENQGFEVAGFGQPLVILLAALIVGSEYQNGLLRSSQLAVPHRARLLGAKAVVIAALSGVLAFPSIGLAVAFRQIVLGHSGIPLFSFTRGMWINLVTVAINWALIGLISGALTVLAKSVLLPVLVLVPMVLGLGVSLVGVFPWLKFAPDLAGLQLLTRYPGIGLLDPIVGGLFMAGWAVALSLAASIVFERRDA